LQQSRLRLYVRSEEW